MGVEKYTGLDVYCLIKRMINQSFAIKTKLIRYKSCLDLHQFPVSPTAYSLVISETSVPGFHAKPSNFEGVITILDRHANLKDSQIHPISPRK